ncbi:MAG: alanine dehydrogenase, partial [Bacteroidota bacterium]
IEQAVRDADVVIGAVLLKGEKTPHLVTEEMVKQMNHGSVIVDVSIDNGGCVETSRPTTLLDPTFIVHHVVHYCVPNMAASVPRTATVGWSNVLLPLLHEASDLGMDEMLRTDAGLAKGVCTYKGSCTNKTAAKIFEIPFVDLNTLLTRTLRD